MDLTREVRALGLAGLIFWVGAGTAFAQAAQAARVPYYDFLMARHLEADGNTAGALAALERAAAADPGSAEIRAEIASLQLRRNQRPEAEKAAKAALALDAENVEANRVLGLLYAALAQGESNTRDQTVTYIRDSVRHLERAAAGNEGPPDVNLMFTLGRMYLANGQTDRAVQVLGEVVEQNPYSAQGRLALSRAHAVNEDLPAAIATLEAIAAEEPGVIGAIGEYQQQAGMLKPAIASYTKALETQPNNTQIKFNRIVALYDDGQYTQAAAFAGDARRQHPADERFPRLQASALFKAGDPARAIEVAESAVKAFPRDTATQLVLADLYGDAGRLNDAERLFRQVLAAQPTNANVLNSLGYLLARNGKDLDEAIRLVNRALEFRPNEAAYLDSLGWAHFKRGDLMQAEKYLGAAAAQMPGSSEVLDHLGDLHARQGRWQDAISAWTRALKGDGAGIDPATVQKKIDDARQIAGK